MKQYLITSKAGVEMGVYTGVDRTEALSALHRDAGYEVSYADGEIVFASFSDAKICGDVRDWHFDEIGA